MPFTEEQQAALEAALASPEESVAYKDRSVRFRSVDELNKARAIVSAGVAGQGTTPLIRRAKIYQDDECG